MILHVAGASIGFGPRTVLREVDFSARTGELTAIVGPNGAGKSTLLRAMCGLHAPAEGGVFIDGTNVREESRGWLARRVGLMTQQLRVPFAFNVLDTVLMGRSPHLGVFGMPGAADREAAMQALRSMGIEELADARLPNLSGGERQRVHFAMCRVQDTPIWLLDEPTSAQDFRGAHRMIGALRGLADAGRTIVCATHDLNLALRAFDRLLLLDAGRVVADGTPTEVVTSGALDDVYRGAVDVVETAAGGWMVGVSAAWSERAGATVDVADLDQ